MMHQSLQTITGTPCKQGDDSAADTNGVFDLWFGSAAREKHANTEPYAQGPRNTTGVA